MSVWTVRTLRTLIFAAAAAVAVTAHSETYPSKPIRLIVPLAAGGGTDFVARALAPKLSEGLKQPVVVENRPGANGAIGSDYVAKGPKDGYTILLGAAGTLVVAPQLGVVMPFDPMEDLAPISLVAFSRFVISLHPSVPADSVRELIAFAKANSGKVNYGTSGTGGAPQLATELFKTMTGVDMVHVPYKGLAPALTDLMGGQIHVVFADLGLVKNHIAAGKLKGIAVTGPQRNPMMPQLPTVSEAGVPGYEAGTWYGIFAAAGTQPSIVLRLNAEIRRALAMPEVQELFAAQGMETSGDTPEHFARFMRSEFDKWGKVIRDAKIKLN